MRDGIKGSMSLARSNPLQFAHRPAQHEEGAGIDIPAPSIEKRGAEPQASASAASRTGAAAAASAAAARSAA